MPTIRIVMPNGTTRAFREGTPKSVIEAAKRDMIASMRESPADHENYRASRRVTLTGWDPDDVGERGSAGPAQPVQAPTPETFDGDEPWNIAATIEPGAATSQNTPGSMTAEQLKQVMPNADNTQIYAMLGPLNKYMTGMTPQQAAVFLAHGAIETGQLHYTREDLNYPNADSIRKSFKRLRGMTDQQLAPYVRNPEKLGQLAYDGMDGNVNPGDGYKYRGGGFLQTTHRRNYRLAGYEDNPEALEYPDTSVATSVDFWNRNHLGDMSNQVLNRAQFDRTTQAIAGGLQDPQKRWDAYQRALNVFGLSPQ